jgi:hypothetical protein
LLHRNGDDERKGEKENCRGRRGEKKRINSNERQSQSDEEEVEGEKKNVFSHFLNKNRNNNSC